MLKIRMEDGLRVSQALIYIMYMRLKYQRVLLFIQDQSDRKVEYMWEDVMLCKPI